MNRDETKLIFAAIASCFPTSLMPPITSELINAWTAILEDLTYEETQVVVMAMLCENRKYPPTPGEIRGRMADAKTNIIPGDQAYGIVREAVRKFGSYRKDEAAVWLGKEIWDLVSRFGWDYFCMMPLDQISTYQSQFRRAWDAESERKLNRVTIPVKIQSQLDRMRPSTVSPALLEHIERPLISLKPPPDPPPAA